LNRLSFVSLFALAACGGLSDTTTLGELTAEDWTALCEEVSVADPQPVTCSDDVEITPSSAAECAEDTEVFAGCTATVGDLRDCMDAINADPCVLLEETPPASCTPVFDCALSGS
jgi:hypothetical protein